MNTTDYKAQRPGYVVWDNMRQRCANPNRPDYKNYGGRGISVCPEWNTYEGFWKDMGATYVAGLQLDRQDNDQGYSPDNCRWVTRRVNMRNTRMARAIDLRAISEASGVCLNTVLIRYKRGWAEAALSRPVATKHRAKRA